MRTFSSDGGHIRLGGKGHGKVVCGNQDTRHLFINISDNLFLPIAIFPELMKKDDI